MISWIFLIYSKFVYTSLPIHISQPWVLMTLLLVYQLSFLVSLLVMTAYWEHPTRPAVLEML